MRIFKWGDGLAVGLPADVVAHLKLKDGDEIDSVSSAAVRWRR